MEGGGLLGEEADRGDAGPDGDQESDAGGDGAEGGGGGPGFGEGGGVLEGAVGEAGRDEEGVVAEALGVEDDVAEVGEGRLSLGTERADAVAVAVDGDEPAEFWDGARGVHAPIVGATLVVVRSQGQRCWDGQPQGLPLRIEEGFDFIEECLELVVVDPVAGVGDADSLCLGEGVGSFVFVGVALGLEAGDER